MYAIIGSGFGLYGYLPALVEGLGQTVVLPQSYKEKVLQRPELSGSLPGIRWVADEAAALAQADAVVIAVPPQRQFEIVSFCVKLPRIDKLILEKPVAPTPRLATELMAKIDAARKHFCVGYTLMNTAWFSSLAWPASSPDNPSEVRLSWTFMAHHFSRDLPTWKRRHAEGGGVLRFFGIHLLAILAHYGYDGLRHSTLSGLHPNEPDCWDAVFTGAGLPP